MANYIVNDTDLTSVANAIRTKSGTSGQLAFPSGFVSAVNSIDEIATMIITGDGNGFVKLPSDVTVIRDSAFIGCDSCCLESLPEGLTHIGENAFYGCINLRITSIPSAVEVIKGVAFYGCDALTTLTFKGTPRIINSSAFTGCINLTTINVPWAEGAVADAPWGANNATINYNYTE